MLFPATVKGLALLEWSTLNGTLLRTSSSADLCPPTAADSLKAAASWIPGRAKHQKTNSLLKGGPLSMERSLIWKQNYLFENKLVLSFNDNNETENLSNLLAGAWLRQ